MWEGTATAVKSLNNSNVLNTTEQISANTTGGNIAGALALKAAMSDYNAKISTINSNMDTCLSWKGEIEDNNANNAIHVGVYSTNPNTQNAPDWGVLMVLTNSNVSWVYQLWFLTNGTITTRRSINDRNSWTQWNDIVNG